MRTNPRCESIKVCKRMWKKHVPSVEAQQTSKHSSIENKKKARQQLDPYQSTTMKHNDGIEENKEMHFASDETKNASPLWKLICLCN